jgi:myosin-7
LQINESVLGYCGDKHMSYPAMLAQDILKRGVTDPYIRDEIYCQLIKHLSSNGRAESVAKGWQLMCMAVGVFSPSIDFEYYLLHYILYKAENGRGAVVEYAKYCIRSLEATLAQGDNTLGYVLTPDEILAYKERPPILASIYVADGTPIIESIPISPDVNVVKILNMVTGDGVLGISDSRVSSLGIFVYDEGPITDVPVDTSQPSYMLRRNPRPLRNEDYMGDVTVQKARQKRTFKFVVKKKIFMPKDNFRGHDPNYERLVYMQAEEDVFTLGTLPVDSADTMAYLSALSLAINYDVEALDLADDELMTFVSPDWKAKKQPDEWRQMIQEQLKPLLGHDPNDLQDVFVKAVQTSPLYGSHLFHVKQIPAGYLPPVMSQAPNTVLLGFSSLGLTIYTETLEKVVLFPFSEIYRWGGSSSQFSLILSDKERGPNESFEFIMSTTQAADMAGIILDLIRAIMEATQS